MPQPLQWSFSQIGGTRAPLTLYGWQAPFGRPRRGTVVNMGLTVRKQVTYYPGKNTPPTVHAFATEGKPFELHGRWMDQAIGALGGAQKMVRDWKDFIADQVEVRAKWGDILSYRIFVHDFDAELESDAELSWKLQAIVLVDEAAPVVQFDVASKAPSDYASQADTLFDHAKAPFTSHGNLLAVLPEISDLFDAIVSVINAPFAAVFDTCASLSDFETALSSDLSRITSGLHTVRTGILELRDASSLFVARTQELPQQESVTGSIFSAPDILSLTADKATADVATANLLALIADMQN